MQSGSDHHTLAVATRSSAEGGEASICYVHVEPGNAPYTVLPHPYYYCVYYSDFIHQKEKTRTSTQDIGSAKTGQEKDNARKTAIA